MSLLKRVLTWLGLLPTSGARYYELDEGLQISLRTLADYEGRSEQELLPDVLSAGFDQYQTFERRVRIWDSLSEREQQVTALTCLGFTNREIAAKLSLSPETIKTHVRHVLAKFEVKGRDELSHILAKWDFSAYL